jgi:prepilin-type N-terminal cleavage/methylation domain-containing protein
MFKKTLKFKGFTVIEILVAISIIALLSTLAMTAVSQARIRGRDTRRKADLEQVRKALILYADEHNNSLPTTGFGSSGNGNGWATNYNNGTICYTGFGDLEDFLDGTDPDVPAPANLYIKMPHDPRCGGCGGTAAQGGGGCGTTPNMGYMYYKQGTGAACAVLFAHLEDPSADDIATCTGKCVPLGTLGTNYGMNYCVEVRL